MKTIDQQDLQIDKIFEQVMDETCKDPLHRFAGLVAEQTHTNNKARWYQEGYEAGQHDMFTKSQNVDTSANRVYASDISATSDKSGISDKADEQAERKPVKSFSGGVPWYATDAPINEEIEMLKAEIKRLQDLAEYRLKLLMQMPENKPWVGLTDEEIEKIVGLNTSDDEGYDIFCDGQGVAKAVEAKLKERNYE